MAGSFWLDESTSIRYNEGRAFSYGEGEDRINYTAAGATPETFASLGFVLVNIQPRPDDRFYIVSGPDDTGAYTAIPRELDDEPVIDPKTGKPMVDDKGNPVIQRGLKSQWEEQQRQTTHSVLDNTDWYVTRKADIGVEIPADIQQFRDNMRLTCGLREDQISQVTTVEQLEALVTNPAFIPNPDDPSGPPIPNPAPHLLPWPEDPTQQA